MSRNLAVFIAIEAADPPLPNEAVTVARVRDPKIVLSVAKAAIAEAASEADEAERSDQSLGIVCRGEHARLKTVLSRLIPELRNEQVPALTM